MDIVKPDGHRESHEGTLAFSTIAEGSKSQHNGPVFHTTAGHFRVYLVGDNPFEHSGLKNFDGQRLHIRGQWKRGVFRIDPDALSPLPHNDTTSEDEPK